MPSKSKSMQRTMGWALACKKGETENCPPNIQKIADTMSVDKLEDFAKTKHKGLPEKKKKKKANESYVLSFEQFLKENKE
jgi:hypothetical protein